MMKMKSYKKCEGCGLELQSKDQNKIGYSPIENSIFCKDCFRSKHYGETKNNLSSFFNFDDLKKLRNDNVLMVIDCLNPFETIIEKANINFSFVGYSNVGKTSLIKSIFKSKNINLNILDSPTIGTTKKIIELNLNNKIIKDFPGLILVGSYQNLLSKEELKIINPKKEIKIKNFQLKNNEGIRIEKYLYIKLNSKEPQGYQFIFSNLLNLYKLRYNFYIDNEIMVSHFIENKSIGRFDLIISGLGIFTFKSNNQKIEIILPKGINFNIVESIFK
jgi:ribosome biogenesis GTPase A